MSPAYPKCRAKGIVQITISEDVRFVDFNPKKPINEIVFSETTDYEIFNGMGVVVSKGNGDKVNITALKNGTFYICYDNKMETFTKKP